MMADRPLQARFLVMHPKTCARCPLRVQTRRSRRTIGRLALPHKRKCLGAAALRQERPVANRIMTMSAFYSILLRSSAGSGHRQGRWACRKLTIADHHHENCGLAEPRPFSFVFPPTRQEKERLLDPLGMKDTTFYAPSLDEHAWKLLNPKLGDMVSGDL